MGRKLARGLSSKRTVDVWYNGGVPGDDGHELYRVHMTIATKDERLQLQALSAEWMATLTNGGAPSQESLAAAYVQKMNEYKAKGQETPEEDFTRKLLASHITHIELVNFDETTGKETGTDEAELDEGRVWVSMSTAQRCTMIAEHPALFARLTGVLVPSPTEGALGKSERRPDTGGQAKGG